MGLSPRPRGNPRRHCYDFLGMGPIPASAGEPLPHWMIGVSSRAYPRVRGGTAGASREFPPLWGLSPRPRGNPADVVECDPLRGPIPASAGEPHVILRIPGSSGAYPRVRGGTIPSPSADRHATGLSPRPRGNLEVGMLGIGSLRPIPASAGEPRRFPRDHAQARAYPRVRGGTFGGMLVTPVIVGLSPRPRGNPVLMARQVCHDGPIPASAGEPR